uniref:hypothetical protein n=1 Tax=Nonomuraea pusilla TaxID=46177 RepID=UPI0006E2AF21|nr:hypothetical protein [Nonomuraea pusilla]
MLGAHVLAVPKAGVIGPVLGGRFPAHMALLALVGLALSGAGAAPGGRGAGAARWPFAGHAFDDAYGSLTSQTSRQILLDFLTGAR